MASNLSRAEAFLLEHVYPSNDASVEIAKAMLFCADRVDRGQRQWLYWLRGARNALLACGPIERQADWDDSLVLLARVKLARKIPELYR